MMLWSTLKVAYYFYAIFYLGGVFCELKQIIDLTWEFNNNTLYWVGEGGFQFTKVKAHKDRGYWYSSNEFCSSEHGGTHFDAPYHFNENGWKVGEVPTIRHFAKGVTIDLRDEVTKLGANATLLPKHLENWEKQHGPFPNRSVLIIWFGWSKYWPNAKEYFGIDENGNMNFPGVSPSAADWIAKTNKFYGVGLDTPSIDNGSSKTMSAHRVFAAHQMYNLENVKIVTSLPPKGYSLIVLPMKIGEGTGAPIRIMAVPEIGYFDSLL